MNHKLDRATTQISTVLGRDFVVDTWRIDGIELLSIHFKPAGRWPDSPYVRVHSACIFGEVFHSLLCDCRQQMDYALEVMAREGGCLIYLYQEGRGAGLASKTRAMELERTEALTTVEAYRKLGFDPDMRNYDQAINVLRLLELPNTLRLITNNPQKLAALQGAGYIVERIEAKVTLARLTVRWVRSKQRALGHFLYSCGNGGA